MKTPTLTVTGPHPFLGHQPGESFDRPSDPEGRRQVTAAISAGVVAYDDPAPDDRMTCPACAERIKRPPKLEAAELAEHYADRHPGLVAPDWMEDMEA